MSKTLFIGLDGATFSILDPLAKAGIMPFLKQFMATGTRAPLLSTANPLTPPAWTSLMTGRNPGSHGVIDFIWAEQRKTDHYFTLYNFRDIQCETIWSIAGRQEKRVCALNFPMMAPPPAINGCIVPGLVSWKHLRRNIHPPELYPALKSIPGFNPREFAWDFGMEKKAANGLPEAEFENWITFHLHRERHWFEIARYLLKQERPDLMAVLFDGPDKMMHIGWRFLDPALYPANPTPWEQRIHDLLLTFFRELDSYLSQLAELAGPETRLFMASDHGFGPAWQVFRVNTWLQQEGYLHWKDVKTTDEKTRESIDRLVDQHFVLLDWERTTAYARTLTSNGIYIQVADGAGQPGIPRDEYLSFRDELINKLMQVKEPETGELAIEKVLTREEAYPGQNNQQAPDLTIVMKDHSFISILNKTPAICRRPQVEGTHYPEGIFIAGGPGIREGVAIDPFPIVDVAPTLLYSVGLDIPSDFEGRVAQAAFQPSILEQQPLQEGAPTLPPSSYAINENTYTLPGDEEKKVMDQLKALGYIE